MSRKGSIPLKVTPTSDLTQKHVREWFDYRDGELFWKVATSRRIKIGDKAGSIKRSGYLSIYVDNVSHRGHRIIWLYHYGWLPKYIDHINGNPSDNRIENLRAATMAENACNRRIKSNNKSGIKGVNWDPKSLSWRVVITVAGKRKWLGAYKDIEEAAMVIRSHREKLHGSFARHG